MVVTMSIELRGKQARRQDGKTARRQGRSWTDEMRNHLELSHVWLKSGISLMLGRSSPNLSQVPLLYIDSATGEWRGE